MSLLVLVLIMFVVNMALSSSFFSAGHQHLRTSVLHLFALYIDVLSLMRRDSRF